MFYLFSVKDLNLGAICLSQTVNEFFVGWKSQQRLHSILPKEKHRSISNYLTNDRGSSPSASLCFQGFFPRWRSSPTSFFLWSAGEVFTGWPRPRRCPACWRPADHRCTNGPEGSQGVSHGCTSGTFTGGRSWLLRLSEIVVIGPSGADPAEQLAC